MTILVNMVNERDILKQVSQQLEKISGMQPHGIKKPDRGVDLVLRVGDKTLVIEVKTSTHAGAIADAAKQVAAAARQMSPKAIGVVAVPFMGELGRQICRDAGVGFIDLSGNADIKAPPLVLHIEGQPNKFIPRGRPSSVFAPKSSRITRLLLLDPQRWWSQNQLVEEGDLDRGYVSRICKRMESQQLIERNSDRALRPRDPNLLLDAWEDHYQFDQHEIIHGHVSARSGEELVHRVCQSLKEHHHNYAVTGLAAAWLLAPFANYRLATVYVDHTPTEAFFKDLKCRREERGANLWLIHPNDEGVFHGGQDIQDISCVSAIQTFIDLQSMPERAEEAASHLRKECLQWQ